MAILLSHNSLNHFLIIVITTHVFLCSFAISQEDTPKLGYRIKERVSLYLLKSSLHNPFLNNVWTGPHCDANDSKWYGIRCDSEGFVTEIVLESLGLRGKLNANAFTAFTELSILILKNNSLGGTAIDFSTNRRLTCVDLSSNAFSGKIPVSLVTIPGLNSIILRDNLLIGQIPELDQLRLREFDVSNNNLSGLIPKTRALQSFPYTSFVGNPNLCGPPSPMTCEPNIRTENDTPSSSSLSSNEDNNNNNRKTNKSFMDSLKWYLLPFEFVLLVVLILLFILYFKKSSDLNKMMKQYHKNRNQEIITKDEGLDHDDHQTTTKSKIVELEVQEQENRRRSSSSRSNNNNITTISFDVPVQERPGKLIFISGNQDFEMSDLLKASAEGLGQGSTFGNCYKAVMEGKPIVVVKRLKNLKPLTFEEFEKQLLLTIAEPKHPNLLPLLAYNYSKDEKLLVHNYVENGNLFNRLHGGRVKNSSKSDRIPFKWCSRLHVARDVARAMSHLHQTNTTSLVPHGNLRSTNVLLLPGPTAVVSDYGLSSLFSLPIAAQRSAAYRSPEFLSSKRVSPKSDVWTYGCLLLELVTGKVSAHTAPPGVRGVDLGAWAHKAVREEWTAEVFDREILGEPGMRRTAVPAMLRLLEIALLCVERSPERRPEMSDVSRMVEEVGRLAADVSESEDVDDVSSLDRSLTDDDHVSTVSSGK